MILVDASIPMYLVGGEHPNKHRAAALVEEAIAAGRRLVTDVEVLQEILHRYVAISRPEAIQPAFDVLLAVVDEAFPIELADTVAAKDVVLGDDADLGSRCIARRRHAAPARSAPSCRSTAASMTCPGSSVALTSGH